MSLMAHFNVVIDFPWGCQEQWGQFVALLGRTGPGKEENIAFGFLCWSTGHCPTNSTPELEIFLGSSKIFFSNIFLSFASVYHTLKIDEHLLVLFFKPQSSPNFNSHFKLAQIWLHLHISQLSLLVFWFS